MIVTFISECQKKSLKLTRQVLDAYAHRIGQRTWQSVMTEQGVQAVRSRLSASARKTTAVACHRVRGTRRTELLWIVGNRQRFDHQGNVPVNRTQRDLLRESDENDWRYLSTLKSIVAIAGLFHDFGKAWDPFQDMLRKSTKSGSEKRDPVRHEWVSLMLFAALIDGKTDREWLSELASLNETPIDRRRQISDGLILSAKKLASSNPYPFDLLESTLAKWVGWLVVSHHRLPRLDGNGFGDPSLQHQAKCILSQIDSGAGYEKTTPPTLDLDKHWKFADGLPFLSAPWCRKVSRWGRKLEDELEVFGDTRIDELVGCERLMLTLSRMALMLGDHQYSSKEEDRSWQTDWPPYANTYGRRPKSAQTDRRVATRTPKVGAMCQRLDEHLVRVTEATVDVAHLLPAFESQMQTAQNLRPLRKPSPAMFAWQNRAADELRKWQQEHRIDDSGFFAVNVASTGKGKTFANAKIMDAISPEGLRYSLALGLRTLTLQTGDEYRDKLKLDTNELAVLIGSAAVRTLHQQRPSTNENRSVTELASDHIESQYGSLSGDSLSERYEFAYDDLIPDDAISTKLKDAKSRQLLKAPILVCTVDHLMPAVENTRGGGQILPMLRMLSADLVIDEVDDFDQGDMPAIARLVHLAGMLGRKVMISSATIAPAVAEGLFHAYREGWCQFAKFRKRQSVVSVFWVDEFAASTTRITHDADFRGSHATFVKKRQRKLQKQDRIACRAEVLPMDNECGSIDDVETQTLRQAWFDQVTQAAIDLHRRHHLTDPASGKHVSFGVIRVANVDPCIDLATSLMKCELPDDVDVRTMPYHARQVLLLRSEQEKHLDGVLCRKNDRSPLDDPIIRRHIQTSQKPHVVFVLVASPVAEVGRDHDFDWAVIEPSSVRSIVQMAGRVLRHRLIDVSQTTPNIILPERNFKGFTTTNDVVFHFPGFEGGRRDRGGGYRLDSKSLTDLIDLDVIGERLDASLRIDCPAKLTPQTLLADLEHQVLRNVLTAADFRPAFVQGWTQCAYFLTSVSQDASPFRLSMPDEVYKLHVTEDGQLVFRHVDPDTGKSDGPHGKQVSHIQITRPDDPMKERLWLSLDYVDLVQRQQALLGKSTRQVCEFLGELRLMDDLGGRDFEWSSAIGAKRSQS